MQENNTNPEEKESGQERKKRKVVRRVLTGTVVQPKSKKGWSDVFAEAVFGEGTKTVVGYLTREILVPTLKKVLLDMINVGSEMVINGRISERRRDSAGPTRIHVPYNSLYSSSGSRPVSISDGRRVVQNPRWRLNEIVFINREDADYILETLQDNIDRFESATVADFYEAAEMTSEFTDRNYGWDTIANSRVVPVPGGYIIEGLGKPLPLE